MAPGAASQLLAELEGSNDGRSPERWAGMLRKVTTLFLSDAPRLSEHQVALFDDVFLRLMKQVPSDELAHLSHHLSGIGNAPRKALRELAFHDDPSVAGPVLRRSTRISDDDLDEIAAGCGQQHLLTVASRQTVEEWLSDRIIERGDSSALCTLVQNLGARFSDIGYSALAVKGMQDIQVAECLFRRSDLPLALRRQLTPNVSGARMRVLQAVPPTLQGKILAAKAEEPARVTPPASTDYPAAMARMKELSRKGGLNDRSVNRFAVTNDYVEVVAALTFLSEAQVEIIAPLIRATELDGIIVACKASRLNWATTKMIIHNRPGMPAVAKRELEKAEAMFDGLSLSVAQRTIRLW